MFYALPPVIEEVPTNKQSPKHKNAAQSDQLHNTTIQVEENIPDESLREVTKSTKDMFKYSQSGHAQAGTQSENSPLLPRFSVSKTPPPLLQFQLK